MNTKINLTYEGEKYCLEYDRMSVKLLETNGFKLDEFLDKPMVNVELAFTCAFRKNHSKVSQNTIDAIYKSCPNKGDLITTLARMIQETYESLLGTDEEEQSGNVSWEVEDLSPKKK